MSGRTVFPAGISLNIADFEFARTGSGHVGSWSLVSIDDSEPQTIAQIDTDRTDYRFPLAICRGVSAADIDVSVRFRPVGGKVDQAGGLAVRLTSANDYYVARANALEDNVRFYRVVAGRREMLAGANLPVASQVWHTLSLRVLGDRFTVSFNGRELFTATDATFKAPGRVALWTKSDSVTYFDHLAINELR